MIGLHWWTKYVDGIGEIPFPELLKNVGLKYTIEAGKDDEQKEEWFTGLRTREAGDFPLVTEVERDSPAWKAGIVAGDTLIAANGLRLTNKDLNDRLWTVQQTPIKLSVFRRDELKELAFAPTKQVKGKAKLKALDDANDQQKALNSKWLGVDWPAKAATAEKGKEADKTAK